MVGLPWTYLSVALALHLLMSLVILRGAPPVFRRGAAPVGAAATGGYQEGMGIANRVTLGRATLVLPLAALVPWWEALGTNGLWWVVVAGGLAMALDGLDGWVARATGTSSAFGARFDMELDAFLLLVLSLLAWLSGPVGPWVILIGALRYLFVAAGWIWPVLQGPLPDSFLRKAVCVVQGVALLVCLGPIVPSAVANAVAAVALAALVGSFAWDVRWLTGAGQVRCS